MYLITNILILYILHTYKYKGCINLCLLMRHHDYLVRSTFLVFFLSELPDQTFLIKAFQFEQYFILKSSVLMTYKILISLFEYGHFIIANELQIFTVRYKFISECRLALNLTGFMQCVYNLY